MTSQLTVVWAIERVVETTSVTTSLMADDLGDLQFAGRLGGAWVRDLWELVDQDDVVLPEVQVWVAGAPVDELVYYVTNAKVDDLLLGDEATVQFSASPVSKEVETTGVQPRALVYDVNLDPHAPASFDPSKSNAFQRYQASAGSILTALLAEAHDQGELWDWTIHGDADRDCLGNPWTYVQDFTLNEGSGYLTAVRNAMQLGLCEFRFVGRELFLYDLGRMDRYLGVPDDGLHVLAPDTAMELPDERDTSKLACKLTVTGNNGLAPVVRVDAGARSRFGRILSATESQPTILTTDALVRYVEYKLPLYVQPARVRTHSYVWQPGTPVPLTDLRAGDSCLSHRPGGDVRRVRIAQVDLTEDDQTDGLLVVYTTTTRLDAPGVLWQRPADVNLGPETQPPTPVGPDSGAPGPQYVPPTDPNDPAAAARYLPAGGAAGQVLTKQTAADGDAGWQDLPGIVVPPASSGGKAWVYLPGNPDSTTMGADLFVDLGEYLYFSADPGTTSLRWQMNQDVSKPAVAVPVQPGVNEIPRRFLRVSIDAPIGYLGVWN